MRWLKGVGAAATVAFAGLWAGFSAPSPTRLTFLAVGQGDCILLTHGGRALMVDAGPVAGSFDAGQRIVVPRLRAWGVERVDLLLLTHPDMDHVGGAASVLSAYPEARLGISAAFRDDPAMQEHLRKWHLPTERLVWLAPESRVTLGSVTVRIVAPPWRPGAEENDGSLWVRVVDGNATALLTGDASANVETRLSAIGDWSAQVLKAGHHGSRTATSPVFLQRVHPQTVVISCGRANRYGHPAPTTLQTLSAAHTTVVRTDRDGDVTFEATGSGFVRR